MSSLKEQLQQTLPQVRGTCDFPVRNCRLGLSIRCDGYEIKKALEQGEYTLQRTASFYQDGVVTGCEQYSTEGVKIICNKEGIPVDFVLPHPDPDHILHFRLYAWLVPYDNSMDMNSLLVGTTDNPENINPEFEQVHEDFCTLMTAAQKDQRQLLPPDQIMVDGKAYELTGISMCQSTECACHSGATELGPFPLILGTSQP